MSPIATYLVISPAAGSRLQMAIRCSSLEIIIPWKAKYSSTTSRSSMLRNCHAQLQVASQPGKKFSLSNKVFEDKENGILCYVDQKGDIVCEGYDEGPRFAARPLQGFKIQRLTIDRSQAEEYSKAMIRQRFQINDFIN